MSAEKYAGVKASAAMQGYTMDNEELELVASGNRNMTETERAWAYDQYDFLWEYVYSQNKDKLNSLTDAELAKEIQIATWDYVRCTCDV